MFYADPDNLLEQQPANPLLKFDVHRRFCLRDRTEPHSAAFCHAMRQIYASMTTEMRAAVRDRVSHRAGLPAGLHEYPN